MNVELTSFGHLFGDFDGEGEIYDARHLYNPGYNASLMPLNGLDERVSRRVLGDPEVQELVADLLWYVEANHVERLAVGCVGGRHRSVTIVEALGRLLSEAGHTVTIVHRDQWSWPVRETS